MPEVYGTGNHDRKAPKTSVPVASPQAHKVEQGGEMQVREQPQPGTSGPVAGPQAHKAEQGRTGPNRAEEFRLTGILPGKRRQK
jgi:hypothetical protein